LVVFDGGSVSVHLAVVAWADFVEAVLLGLVSFVIFGEDFGAEAATSFSGEEATPWFAVVAYVHGGVASLPFGVGAAPSISGVGAAFSSVSLVWLDLFGLGIVTPENWLLLLWLWDFQVVRSSLLRPFGFVSAMILLAAVNNEEHPACLTFG